MNRSIVRKIEMSIKLGLARKQLGTALALFIKDEDPVSVHCLVCGGGELAYQLASRNDRRSWIDERLKTNGSTNLRSLLDERNAYWNAMKHATQRGGAMRDDVELMRQFDDELNDQLLFIGWYDFACAGGRMPVEAHIYQRWFLARYPEILGDEGLQHELAAPFSNIEDLNRADAKRRLGRTIDKVRKDRAIFAGVKVDYRRLILGRKYHAVIDEPDDFVPFAPQSGETRH